MTSSHGWLTKLTVSFRPRAGFGCLETEGPLCRIGNACGVLQEYDSCLLSVKTNVEHDFYNHRTNRQIVPPSAFLRNLCTIGQRQRSESTQ